MSAVSVDRTYLAWASTAAFDPYPTFGVALFGGPCCLVALPARW
jgi:hypothetical protein